MPRFRGELGEGEAGTRRCRGTCDRDYPQGLTRTWVQAEGGKGGSEPAREKAADAGMRHRDERRRLAGGGRG